MELIPQRKNRIRADSHKKLGPRSNTRPAYGLPQRGSLRGPFAPIRDAGGRFQELRRDKRLQSSAEVDEFPV